MYFRDMLTNYLSPTLNFYIHKWLWLMQPYFLSSGHTKEKNVSVCFSQVLCLFDFMFSLILVVNRVWADYFNSL